MGTKQKERKMDKKGEIESGIDVERNKRKTVGKTGIEKRVQNSGKTNLVRNNIFSPKESELAKDSETERRLKKSKKLEAKKTRIGGKKQRMEGMAKTMKKPEMTSFRLAKTDGNKIKNVKKKSIE